MALVDQALVRTLTKTENIMLPSVQTLLLDFVGDVFIQELFFDISKYMQMTEKRQFYKHAYQKAEDIIKKLREYHKILFPHPSSEKTSDKEAHSHQVENYKRYKSLSQMEKLACIINDDDFKAVEHAYAKMTKLPPTAGSFTPAELES